MWELHHHRAASAPAPPGPAWTMSPCTASSRHWGPGNEQPVGSSGGKHPASERLHPPAPAVTSAPDVATLPWAPAGDVAVCRAVLGPPAMELGASIALKEKETAAAGSSATRITKGARRGTPTASPVGFPRQEAKGWFAGSHALRCALAHEKELDPEPRTGTAAVAAEHSGGWGHGYVAPALTGTKVE